MPTFSTYEYAYVRVVPRVERGEFLNVGVILFCRTRRFLMTRIKLDAERLQGLAPALDIAVVQEQLALLPRICAGEGPIGQLGQAEAFHWLVAPHSTVIQTSPVHAGMCDDPAQTLEHLVETL
ncbi:MAG: DUF3037 domain-containing protein [Chloroflexi bacterium]|nr:DUF3037 domain-containing protein [Chloroflexota bacterium]